MRPVRARSVQLICGHKVSSNSDRNNLCRTCKTWYALVLPVLYKHIDLVVPHDPTRYNVLENLLSHSGEGLKSTKSIIIRTPRKHASPMPMAALDESDAATAVNFPEAAWSDTLNALLRSLIRGIPKHNLESFLYVPNVSKLLPSPPYFNLAQNGPRLEQIA